MVELVVATVALNVAFTAWAPLIVTEQVPVPMQAPLQPATSAPSRRARRSSPALDRFVELRGLFVEPT